MLRANKELKTFQKRQFPQNGNLSDAIGTLITIYKNADINSYQVFLQNIIMINYETRTQETLHPKYRAELAV